MSEQVRENNQEGDGGKKKNDGGGEKNIYDATKDLSKSKNLKELKKRADRLDGSIRNLMESSQNRFIGEYNKITQWGSVDPRHAERRRIVSDQIDAIASIRDSCHFAATHIKDSFEKQYNETDNSHRSLRFSSSARTAFENLLTDLEKQTTALAEHQPQRWEDLENRLREAREEVPPPPKADITRWERTGFPGNGWNSKDFPPREGLNIPQLNLNDYQQLSSDERASLMERIYPDLERIHPQLRALERAEVALKSAESQYTRLVKNIGAPWRCNECFSNSPSSPRRNSVRKCFSCGQGCIRFQALYGDSPIIFRVVKRAFGRYFLEIRCGSQSA